MERDGYRKYTSYDRGKPKIILTGDCCGIYFKIVIVDFKTGSGKILRWMEKGKNVLGISSVSIMKMALQHCIQFITEQLWLGVNYLEGWCSPPT